jgi:hypothetical protein
MKGSTMMHKKGLHIALAASIAAGIIYSIKTLLLIFFPEHMLKMAGYAMHLTPNGVSMITPYIAVDTQGFLMGLLLVMVWVFLIALIFAWVMCALRCYTGDCHCCHDAKPGMHNNNKPGCPPGGPCR